MYGAPATSTPETTEIDTSTSFFASDFNGNRNGDSIQTNGATPPTIPTTNGVSSSQSSLPDWLQEKVDESRASIDVPLPTENGGYSHTNASRAKISAANKGKTPWNKGKGRSEEVKARIAAGVRRKNRERHLQKLKEMGTTEEEYNAKKAKEKAEKEAERRARRTEKGGYRPTDETKQKISKILKAKWASGSVKKRSVDPAKVRRGFKHSEETRAKISASLRNRWATDEDYRNHMMNKTVVANRRGEVRERISATLKKKWQDPEFRANMTAKIATRKRPTNSHGASHREKISAAMKARWQDEGYRKRATEGIARRRAELEKSRPPRIQKPKPVKQAAPKATNAPGAAIAQPMLAQPMSHPKTKVKGVRKRTATKSVVTGDLNGLQGPATVKKKKRVVKKKKVDAVTTVAAAATALEPTTKPKPKKKKKQKEKKKKEAPGSVTRMREERRDLYDLLYGDEEANDGETEQGDDRGSVLPTTTDEDRLSFLDDENLDNYDPYGLEDF